MRSIEIKHILIRLYSQKTWDIGPTLVYFWANVVGLLHIYIKKIKLLAMPSLSELLDD